MVPHNNDRSIDEGDLEIETHRRKSEPVIDTVTRALAACKNVPVVELDPLYYHVEPGALVTLLHHAEEYQGTVSIEFGYKELTVTISHDGSVYIHKLDPIS